ncbi:MAG TPA: hypothetical protein VMW91_09550 [Desulfosporosinus sp.]|nr:hypothetical protein [Desulfosporosinus sp.]
MAITLFNPTNEDFDAQYGGSNFVIPAYPKDGHMVRVDDNKANHVLNQFGPRGLTSLDYGDEGEVKKKKAEDGIRRNLEFKKIQISRYNRDNEARKARQLEYVDPPKHIKDYAKEVGVGLIQPYEIADIKNEEISQLRKDVEKRDKQNDALQKQIAELMALVKKKVIPKTDEESEIELIESVTSEVKMMNRQTFRPWAEKLGQETYGNYPIEAQMYILEKWEGFFNKEEAPFPY